MASDCDKINDVHVPFIPSLIHAYHLGVDRAVWLARCTPVNII